MKKDLFSVIVPVKAYNPYCDESLGITRKLYPGQEILFSPDEKTRVRFKNIKVLASGPVPPSHKRDLCMNKAKGKYMAFLDDDAYPAPGWLEAAEKIFKDPKVGAVGGPAVTPGSDSRQQWASGLVYSSLLCGGPYAFRYVPRERRLVDDYPTVNLIVRKDVLKAIGGFSTLYWPGEDTVACLKIVHEQNKQIVYEPKALVYHHRRQLFWGHFKQVNNYARHRGFFVRKFPETSLRASYFLPSALLAWVVLGWAPALEWKAWLNWWLASLAIYGLAAMIEGLRLQFWAPPQRRAAGLLALQVALGIVLTHLSYGANFLVGLFSRKLD